MSQAIRDLLKKQGNVGAQFEEFKTKTSSQFLNLQESFSSLNRKLIDKVDKHQI